jgi:2-aminobenzoate-CoA ligase
MSKYTGHIDTYTRDHLPPRKQWPEFRFELPELLYSEKLNCATDLLDDAIVEGHGERNAFMGQNACLSYSALQRSANQFANLLVDEMGLVPGNRVLLRSANHPMLAAAWLGVMKAGGVAVTTMPMLRSKELSQIANKAQVTHALYDERLEHELLLAAGQTGLLQRRFGFSTDPACLGKRSERFANIATSRDDVALLAFTSGTTGEPKATMHFHRDVLAMADVVAGRLLRTMPDDVYVGSPPLGFTFGLGVSLVFPLRFRASAVLIEAPSPDRILEAIHEHRVTFLCTAPTMYRALLPLLPQSEIGTLKLCLSAGEALPRPTSDAWFEATGMRIIDGIGATELIHIFISARGDDIRPGATGKPLPGYTACVVDEQFQPLPRGSTGLLAVKGPTGCRYLDDPRQADYVRNGWNITGDTYRVDEDGYFWFEARADDIILSSGYNIAGPEVESALLEHAAIAECAVVGAPDKERGTVVRACVVLREGFEGSSALTKELQDFVKQRIAPYKYPRVIDYFDTLPKTQTGKLQRFRLRSN